MGLYTVHTNIKKTNTLHYKLTYKLFILTIKHTLSSLNIIYTLLFITIHIIINYILILKKQTLYTINLHINYTLDKYTIHFTYTLFILNIYTIYINNKTYTFQFKHNL